MKILVVGSGGREHAIVWKLAQSKRVKKIYCAPGNGGIAHLAELVPVKADDLAGLLAFSKAHAIDLVVVGPEVPLALGIVDLFAGAKIKVFGPTKELARMEASKAFSKEIMNRLGVPTAESRTFKDAAKAKDYIRTKGAPIVIKADGLAAGKGVIVAKDKEEALGAISNIMDYKVFGAAGDSVIVEECLEGEEVSILVISDGNDFVCLPSSQDHKRVFDRDEGPNTGGMGAYSPAPVVTETLYDEIERTVIAPVIKGLAAEGKPYKGVLYAGIMLTKTGPKVLEFNVRFGDPETQAILPRLKTDLVDIMEASIDGTLRGIGELSWSPKPCVSVVMASAGYPGDYKKGYTIEGLEKAHELEDTVVFHAGTKAHDGAIVTDGGRVLGVTALGDDIAHAIRKAYRGVASIHFEGAQYRTDIGARALHTR
ncbi:MAG: phosphoribosylamine--glycine ligase [Candidatus Omnitrophota bacterium]